jgi:hypothetical protein
MATWCTLIVSIPPDWSTSNFEEGVLAWSSFRFDRVGSEAHGQHQKISGSSLVDDGDIAQ